MTGGQVAALGCAGVLLLPGGCFLFIGLAESDHDGLGIGIAILAVAGVLFWVAFGRRSAPVDPRLPPPGDPNQ